MGDILVPNSNDFIRLSNVEPRERSNWGRSPRCNETVGGNR